MADTGTTDAAARDPFADLAAAARDAQAKAKAAAADLTTKARLTRMKAIIEDQDFRANMDMLTLLGVGIGGNIEAICENNAQGYGILLKAVPEQLAALK